MSGQRSLPLTATTQNPDDYPLLRSLLSTANGPRQSLMSFSPYATIVATQVFPSLVVGPCRGTQMSIALDGSVCIWMYAVLGNCLAKANNIPITVYTGKDDLYLDKRCTSVACDYGAPTSLRNKEGKRMAPPTRPRACDGTVAYGLTRPGSRRGTREREREIADVC